MKDTTNFLLQPSPWKHGRCPSLERQSEGPLLRRHPRDGPLAFMTMDPIVEWATVVAGFAGLIAVIVGYLAIVIAREERKSRERSQAALVLSAAHLLRRRMDGFWAHSVVKDTNWPSKTQLDYWLAVAESEFERATSLLERAAAVDLRVANYAELAMWHTDQLRHEIGAAQRAWVRNIGEEGAEIRPAVAAKWPEYRERIVVPIKGALVALDQIEASFPERARLVEGIPSTQHLSKADEEIQDEARRRARRLIDGENGPRGQHDDAI